MAADAAGAARYKRNVYIVGVAFFLVFTAFMTIQNLEASIVGGHCESCTEVCWAGSDKCVDGGETSKPKTDDTTCSWTADDGTLYCAKFGGSCESTCPNNVAGSTVVVHDGNTTSTPAFDTCGGSNVGSIALAVLYATFTVCCLFGPYVVEVLGTKWSIVSALFLYAVFCLANLVIAIKPASTALQWGLLVPASAMVGVAASFLWTAQGAYVTVNANMYAEKLQLDAKAALGEFNGLFFGIFQCTQITGNLAAGILLSLAGLSNTVLMAIYLCFAAGGTVFALLFLEDVKSDDPAADTTSVSTAPAKRSPMDVVKGMTGLWRDPRLALIIPAIMYSGIEQGFIWGTYTSNWVKESVGTANIGYVMAAFGACDVFGSLMFGKLSDITGRFPVVSFGAACQLAVVITLKLLTVGDCDKQWGVLIVCAGLWGLGDAVWNTQLCAVLGDNFGEAKEDAFANFKFWQSLAVAVMFGLGYDPNTLTEDDNVYIVLATLVAGYVCFAIAFFTVGLSGKEEEKRPLVKSQEV